MDKYAITVNVSRDVVLFWDIGVRSQRRTQFPFSTLWKVAVISFHISSGFVGFGIFSCIMLHSGNSLFRLPVHLFSDESPFDFPHPQCLERTLLFTESPAEDRSCIHVWPGVHNWTVNILSLSRIHSTTYKQNTSLTSKLRFKVTRNFHRNVVESKYNI